MPTYEGLHELGMVLRRRREELGLGRSEVARLVGVSPTYVATVEEAKPSETGHRKPPRPGQAVLISWTRALGMEQEASSAVLALAGHILPTSARSQMVISPESVAAQQVLPWRVRTAIVQARLSEIVRRLENHARAEQMLALVESVFDLITYRLDGNEKDKNP